ncbi:MAG: BamA/TamA family outer membrane protein, partial [Merismopedia sp. SIO2A8]|nr:BamA/TamA family outer membrane protein [Merismopedia sp. SIO2A8]
IEDRITLARNQNGGSVVQVAPFFDMGAVWNDSDNPNRLKGDTFLAGLGLGLILNPLPRLNLRVDFTIPLLDIDDRGENAQDDGIFFSVNYGF